MVYENNPYPSKQGTKYLQGIFDLIFRPDPSDPSQLANDGVKSNRDFFNSHKGGLSVSLEVMSPFSPANLKIQGFMFATP